MILFLLLAFVFVLIQIGVISYVFEKVGIAPQYMFLLLLASLLGSYVNIPVKRFVEEKVVEGGAVDFFGFRYVIPRARYKQESLIAVNVGGAVVPTLISVYLLIARDQIVQMLVATLLVALVVNRLARPIRGLGIAVPVLVAPTLAAIISVILAPTSAAPVAYVGGTMGTLIGADILNLHKIRGLGAPVASIGGAGTFDGVFLTGIVAVLLAAL
jgi:uncharacterized membrane protein